MTATPQGHVRVLIAIRVAIQVADVETAAAHTFSEPNKSTSSILQLGTW